MKSLIMKNNKIIQLTHNSKQYQWMTCTTTMSQVDLNNSILWVHGFKIDVRVGFCFIFTCYAKYTRLLLFWRTNQQQAEETE